MLLEILYGTVLILVTTLLGLAALPLLDWLAARATPDEAARHGPGWLLLQVGLSVIWLLTLILMSCWVWSLLLLHLDPDILAQVDVPPDDLPRGVTERTLRAVARLKTREEQLAGFAAVLDQTARPPYPSEPCLIRESR